MTVLNHYYLDSSVLKSKLYVKIAITVLKELSEQKNISQSLWSKHPVDIEEIEQLLYYANKINQGL